MSSSSSVITRSVTSPMPTSRRNKTQQPPPPTPRSKWTEIEHGQLVDGIATYGIDNKKELELLIPSRSAGAVSTYLTRNRDKLLSDYRKFYSKGSDDDGGDTDDDDDHHDVDVDVDVDVDSEEEEDDDSKDDNDKNIKRSTGNQSSVSSEISPPKKKVKRNEDDDEVGDNNNNFSTSTTTEPVGFFASVSRFLSGTWFWPSQMPTNDDGNNGGNDGTTNIETTAAIDKNNDDDDDKADENEMKVSKSDDDDDDDLLQFLPDVGIKFLNSMNINSGKELLESKSGELGDQYALFREENGMSVYKGNGASGMVSQWKKIIRDEALVVGDSELANLNTNKSMTYTPQKKSRGNQQKQYTPVMTKHSAKKTPSRPITTSHDNDNDGDDDDDDLLQLLPNGGVQFLSSINIKSARAFLETKTGNVGIEYKSFREAQTGTHIGSATAVSRISIWKATIRDAALAGGDIELANLNLRKQHQFKNSKN